MENPAQCRAIGNIDENMYMVGHDAPVHKPIQGFVMVQEVVADNLRYAFIPQETRAVSRVGVLFDSAAEFLAFGRVRVGIGTYVEFALPCFDSFFWNRIEQSVCYELKRLVFQMRKIVSTMPLWDLSGRRRLARVRGA